MDRGALKRKIRSAVEEVSDGGEKINYRCLADIDAERRCTYVQTNFVPANFKRHLITSHPDVAKRLELVSESDIPQQTRQKRPKISRVNVETNRKQVLLGTLQLVTDNNLPLKYPQWKSVKILIEPLWKSVGLKITRNTLPVIIARAADIMRKILSEIFSGKLVCLKVDSATRHAKSIFGINLSLSDSDGNVQIYHIGKLFVHFKRKHENGIESESHRLLLKRSFD